MSPTRQQARQHARDAQAGAGPQANFIEMVAQAVSLGVVQALRGLQTQPGCAVCVHEGKVAEAIARKALEPFEPRIRQSVTVVAGRPVCWEHAEEPKMLQSVNDLRVDKGLPPYPHPEADVPGLYELKA